MDRPNVNNSGLIRIDDAARFLGVSEITVRRLIYSKRLAHRRIGKIIMFTQKDLDSFVQDSMVPALGGV